jgi:hypothetical protein
MSRRENIHHSPPLVTEKGKYSIGEDGAPCPALPGIRIPSATFAREPQLSSFMMASLTSWMEGPPSTERTFVFPRDLKKLTAAMVPVVSS